MEKEEVREVSKTPQGSPYRNSYIEEGTKRDRRETTFLSFFREERLRHKVRR